MVAATAVLFAVQSGFREHWIHPINESRNEHGAFYVLWPQIANDDERCKMYIRMTKKQFDMLYGLLGTKLKKQNTNFRDAISPEEKLLVCLR